MHKDNQHPRLGALHVGKLRRKMRRERIPTLTLPNVLFIGVTYEA